MSTAKESNDTQDSMNASDSQIERKRARNRLSQRFFRERRKVHLQELENRVKSFAVTDNERNKLLITENTHLRKSLVQTRKRMASLISAITTMDDKLKVILEESQGTNENLDEGDSQQDEVADTQASQDPHVGSFAEDYQHTSLEDTHSCGEGIDLEQWHDSNHSAHSPVRHSPRGEQGSSHTSGQPINVVDSQDGHNAVAIDTVNRMTPLTRCSASTSYNELRNSTDASAISYFHPHAAPRSNSSGDSERSWEEYISMGHALNQCGSPIPGVWPLAPHMPSTSISWSQVIDIMVIMGRTLLTPLQPNNAVLLSQSCLAMIITFIRYMWPGPCSMVFSSFIYPMIESISRWQLCPTPKYAQALPPYHIQTELQVQKPHSAIIDWVTIPFLRDLLIKHYNFSPQLDSIFVDLMEHSVVELEDISTVFSGVGKGPGYIGIWNIFHTIESNAQHKCSSTADTAMPSEIPPELTHGRSLGLLQTYQMPLAGDVESTASQVCRLIGEWEPITPMELFSSPIMAQKLYYHLELYRADKGWRIDPAFFDKYPLLMWEGSAAATASGTRFRFNSFNARKNVVWSFEQMVNEYQRTLSRLQSALG